MNVHFMSETNEWATPLDLFEQLDNEFKFSLDPCANSNNAKCKKYFTKSDNGLSKSWANERVFMNPPYGREIAKWIEKAYLETKAMVVCLIPARTDTIYWHKYVMQANEIRFIKGRLKFGESSQSAPFPSCIVVFEVGRHNTACSRTAGTVRQNGFTAPKVLSVSTVGTPISSRR